MRGREERRRWDGETEPGCAGLTIASGRRRPPRNARPRSVAPNARARRNRSTADAYSSARVYIWPSRFRRIPIPSASSSTSAPGHTRCSNPGISNGPEANVSPGSSRSCFDARATSRSRPSAVPFRFPLTHFLAVDPDRDERGLRIELVRRHDARSDRDRDAARSRHRIAVRTPCEPVTHERVAEDDRGCLLRRDRVVHRAPKNRRDLRMELQPARPDRPRGSPRPARTPAVHRRRHPSNGARSAGAPRADVAARRRRRLPRRARGLPGRHRAPFPRCS